MNNSEYNRLHQVLLIDHQVETAKNTSFLLELAGYEVTCARGLDEAINFVSTFWPEEDGPRVVLIDNLKIKPDSLALVDLLARRCRSSSFLIVKREDQADKLVKARCRSIGSLHLLDAIRKTILEQTLSNNCSDCFQCVHSYGQISAI